MISSVAGRLGPVLRTGYAAAKHGLIGYGDALRAEVETAYGIKVTNVLPGSVRTSVAANALQGDGSARGDSDANIEAGMDPAECARRILDGLAEGTREIVVAEGAEAFAAGLRWQDPERLFDLLAAEGERLAEEREAGRAARSRAGQPHLLLMATSISTASSRRSRASTARRSPSSGAGASRATGCGSSSRSSPAWAAARRRASTASRRRPRRAPISPIRCSARGCANVRQPCSPTAAQRAEAILGPIDAIKLRSSMTLFEAVADDPAPFAAVLDAFFGGERDAATLNMLDG